MGKHCHNCGKKVEDHHKFCSGCGTKMIEEVTEKKPSPPKAKDKCSNCGSKNSKTFWDYEDSTALCDDCHTKIGKEWQEEIKSQTESEISEPGFFKKNKNYFIVSSILLIFLCAGAYYGLFLFNIQYQATEEYMDKESYTVQVPYVIQEAYQVTVPYIETESYTALETVTDTVPVQNEVCGADYSNLDSVSGIVGAVVKGLNGDDPFETCRTVTDYQNIERQVPVTKYRDVTKYRTETRYQDVTKYNTETRYKDVVRTRSCIKSTNFYNKWTGKTKYYFRVGEV